MRAFDATANSCEMHSLVTVQTASSTSAVSWQFVSDSRLGLWSLLWNAATKLLEPNMMVCTRPRTRGMLFQQHPQQFRIIYPHHVMGAKPASLDQQTCHLAGALHPMIPYLPCCLPQQRRLLGWLLLGCIPTQLLQARLKCNSLLANEAPVGMAKCTT